MSSIRKPDVWIGILAVLSVGGYVLAASLLHDAGFPLDDGWIHQTYARNLAERGEWAFVPGETSVASTSPLWTVLLAVGYLFHIPYLAWTFALGALALAGAGWTAHRLGAALFPDLAHTGTWTGLSVTTAWHLIWAAASGMETMLFSLLSLVLVGLGWRAVWAENGKRFTAENTEKDKIKEREDRPGRVGPAFREGALLGAVGAALTLTRPEGMGLLALTVAAVLMAHNLRKRGVRCITAWIAGAGLAWLVCTAPYVIWNYHVSGDLLPETAAAKQAEYAIHREQWSLPERYGRLVLPLLAGGLVMLLPGIVAALVVFGTRMRRDRRNIVYLLPFAWAILLLTAYALRLPASYQHGRYVMPLLPHLLLYGVGGTLWLLKASRRRPGLRILSRALALSAVLVTLGFVWLGARQYARDVRIIDTEMVETAHWVERNLPPEDLLAVHDIGALGYFAPRPILDLAGLVSPEVVPLLRDDAGLMRLLCARRASYLMVFPDQRPAAPDDPLLGRVWEYDPALGKNVIQPVFRSQTPYAVEAGGGHMMVYAFNWPENCGP